MKTTKVLFFELMYDFQSERWNEFKLLKLPLCRLQLNRRPEMGFSLSLGVYHLIAKQIAGKSRPAKTWGSGGDILRY
jgi:hypothetical protein